MHEKSPFCSVVMGAYPQPTVPTFPKGGRGDFVSCSNTNPPLSPFQKSEAASGHIHGQAPNLCRWLIPVIIGLCLLTAASPALAHRVLVYAYADGDTIHTESKFVGSGAVQQGQVQVLDQKTGRLLLSGKTDDQGKYAFKIPVEAASQRLDLLIVVEASMGHRGEWPLTAESYLPSAAGAGPSPAPMTPSATAPASSPTATPATAVRADAGALLVDLQALEEILNKALERQLAPMKEMLAASQVPKTTLSEIVGGIGYIIGFFGLLAYFQSKKRRNP